MTALSAVDRLCQPRLSAERRVAEVVERAQAAFWNQVAIGFPDAEIGDLASDVQEVLDAVLLDAVCLWLDTNQAPAQIPCGDTIQAVRIETTMGRATALVTCGAGKPERFCSWLTDDHDIRPADFLGKTRIGFRRRFDRCDVTFLQS